MMEYIIVLLLIIIISLIWYIKRTKYNKVHFYVTRDKSSDLVLWLNKPFRGIEMWINIENSFILAANKEFSIFNLNMEDYNNLTFEDEPLEVYLNLNPLA